MTRTSIGGRIRGALGTALLAGLAAGCPSGPARADTADAAMAARLEAELNDAPCQPLATFSVPIRCQWQGRITVATAGDRYRAEVPGLTILLGANRRIELGTLALALTPQAGGALAFALTLPPSFALAAKAGDPELSAAAAEAPSIEGLWQPAAHGVTRLDARAHGLRLSSPADPHTIAIGSLSLTGALAETAPGRWGGPVALALGDLAVRAPDGSELAHLGSASFEGRVSELDLALALARRAQSEAARTAEASAPPAAPANTATNAKKGSWASARHYLARLQDLFGGGSVGIRLGDLSIRIPMTETTIALGGIEYHTALDGLERGKSTLSVGYRHGPLTVTPTPALQDFMPKTARLALTATGLPNGALWQALERAAAGDDRGTDRRVKDFLADADAALTQAGANLTIEGLDIDTPATTLKLTGQARYDAAAALGMDARADMAIRGFDAALKALLPAPGAASLSDDSKTMLSALTMLQVMGLPAKDETGRDTRTYQVQAEGSGAITLNGADITILVQSLRDRLGRHAQPAGTAPGR